MLAAFARVLRRPRDPLGDRFAKLSDEQRVDFVFAIAALEESSSTPFLERALEDPCEAVALAAAVSLAKSGRAAQLDRYFGERPGERAERLRLLVEVLH